MVCSAQKPITLLLIQAKVGPYLAFVPNELSQDQVEAGLQELGIDVEQIAVVQNWRTTSSNLAVASLTFPEPN